MLRATRRINYRDRVFERGDVLPDDPAWSRAWLDAGSAAETVPEPSDRMKAEIEQEPGEEVLTRQGTQITDRLPKRKPPSKK